MSEIICPSCGDNNSPSSWKYCHKCGGRLDGKVAPTNRPGTPSAAAYFGATANQAVATQHIKYIGFWAMFGFLCGFGLAGAIVNAIIAEALHLQTNGTPGIASGAIIGGVVLQSLGYRRKPKDKKKGA